MRVPIRINKRVVAVTLGAALVVAATVRLAPSSGHTAKPDTRPRLPSVSSVLPVEAAVELLPTQLEAVKLARVGTHPFVVEKEAVGSIDYDEDLAVQVFPPYQGKILTAFTKLGDAVEKGQPLYTLDSPDLIQAESTLIGAVATFALTSKELARVQGLAGTNGLSQRELEQATSDQQTAEGALKAARDAVRLFGKTDGEIDQIAARRKIDPVLVVRSPTSGRVIARNAQPGLLVQPGIAPAPYAVADLTTKWMVANCTESDCPLFQIGQPVRAHVMAYPGRSFTGRISRMGAAVDPATHRVMVRCEIHDPNDELRPGMLANFVIQVRAPVESVALPENGVVRNGDGTLAAWVTSDRRRFTQRLIQVGLQQDGQYQVLEGLRSGEWAVTDGAVFLNNMLEASPSD